jgi:hypothetical protein
MVSSRRYGQEDDGVAEDGDTKFLVDDDRSAKLEAELQKKLTRRDGSMMTLSQSKKYSQMHADNTAWEENRLLTSGVVRAGTLVNHPEAKTEFMTERVEMRVQVRQTQVDTDFDNEDENRITLLVHDTKPPFLDGRIVFTKQVLSRFLRTYYIRSPSRLGYVPLCRVLAHETRKTFLPTGGHGVACEGSNLGHAHDCAEGELAGEGI